MKINQYNARLLRKYIRDARSNAGSDEAYDQWANPYRVSPIFRRAEKVVARTMGFKVVSLEQAIDELVPVGSENLEIVVPPAQAVPPVTEEVAGE